MSICDTPLIESPSKLDTESPSHPSKYLNDLEEWNRNQYNPGYWTDSQLLHKIFEMRNNHKYDKIT